MTITVLNSQSHNSPGYGDPVAWSVTVPDGSERVLIVSAPAAATAVTYAGIAMSLVQSSLSAAVAIDQWMLVNPPVGTANVSFTFGSPYTQGPYTAIVVAGVDQATPYSLAEYVYNAYQTSPMAHTMAVSSGGVLLATLVSLYTGDPTISGDDTKLLHLVEGRANTIAVTATDDGTVSFSGWPADVQSLIAGIALNPSSGAGPGDATVPGATLTATSSLTPGTATGGSGATGSFHFDDCENNTGAGVLDAIAVSWTWISGAVGSASAIANGSGTMTTAGMTVAGLPLGNGFGIIKTPDGLVVAYQQGTVT